MKPGPRDSKRQTVLLAADVGSYSITIVNLAVDMAAAADTQLLGLFVEDEDLLQVSGLPCTREITLTTARERPTSTDQMQRSMRSVAQHFKQTLQQEAQALQIVWRFDTIRGRMRDIGLKPVENEAYIILGQSISHQLPARKPHGPRRILVVDDHSLHYLHALEVLLRRFAPQDIEVALVRADPASEVSTGIAQQIKTRDKGVKLLEFKREQLFDLLQRAGSSFDCAIVSKFEPVEELQRILERLRCPVILVA